MKILSLRFANLNSLVGEWHIDFTDDRFLSDGIFLITGATGAGKTTILDAICIALFGRTPRVAKLGQASNEIMAQSAGDCFAEVVFEAGGVRYRSFWEQKRSGKRAKDPFAKANYSLEKPDTGEVVGSGVSFINKGLKEIIHMDFDQFTRSMLLAQGDFAAFLRASAKDRGEILEQITGTEIYAEISRKIFEIAKERQKDLENRKAETGGIELLDEAQENDLHARIADCAKMDADLAGRCAELARSLEWLKLVASLESQLNALRNENDKLIAAEKSFAPEKIRLEAANRAEACEKTHAQLVYLREKLENTNRRLIDLDSRLPGLEDERDKAAKKAKICADARENSEKALGRGQHLLEMARDLDKIIAGQAGDLASEKQNLAKAQAEKDNFTRALEINSAGLIKARESAAGLDAWLEANARRAKIAPILPALTEKSAEIRRIGNNIRDKKKKLASEKNKAAAWTRDIGLLQKEIASVRTRQTENEAALTKAREDLKKILAGSTIEELRREKDAVYEEREKALLLGRLDIVDLRNKLVDGSPCPVCGATHHPLAGQKAPVTSDLDRKLARITRLIESAEKARARLESLEKNAGDLESQAMELKNRENRAQASLDALNENIAGMEAEIALQESDLKARLADCAKALLEFDLDIGAGLDKALNDLEGMRVNYELHLKEKDENAENIRNYEKKRDLCENDLKNNAAKLFELGERLAGMEKALEENRARRAREYGEINDAAVQKLANEAEKAKEDHARALKSQENTATDLAECQGSLEILRGEKQKQAAELAESREAFAQAIAKEGFVDENAFLAARLPGHELDDLREREKKLVARKQEILGAMKDNSENLERARAQKLTDLPLEDLQAQLNAAQDERQKLAGEKGALMADLARNSEARAKLGAKKAVIERLEREYETYAQVNDLIGSRDGTKYTRFAQGLTFEILVGHANRELEKMSDRYLLTLDRDKPLELSIIDNYQGGEVRSTQNLSGGESFIVSLSLALGLAGMASKKTSVDSLFLDEGFGTLDEDTLETALATLESLRREGKLIGIISHVAALRERIGTRIEVIGLGGGRSRIAGPGCSRRR